MAIGISGMLALVNVLGGLIFGYNTGVIAGANKLISATGSKWGIQKEKIKRRKGNRKGKRTFLLSHPLLDKISNLHVF